LTKRKEAGPAGVVAKMRIKTNRRKPAAYDYLKTVITRERERKKERKKEKNKS
jgi:hypothetical protein